MDGLNLGLAINIADNASVNANKISMAIDRLIKLGQQLAGDAKRTGAATDKLALDFAEADHRARQAGRGVLSFSHSLQRATPNLVDFRAGVVRLFPYVSIVGGLYAVKRAVQDIVDTGSSFGYAIANIAAVANVSVQEMKKIEKVARDLAATSVFTASQVAESMYDLVSAGVAAKDLGPLTEATLSYATATQYSVKESGLDMLSVLNKLKQPATEAAKYFDKMSYATNISTLTAQHLSEMLKVVGTDAISLGVSFDDLLGVLGVVNLAFKGSEGATRMRMILQGLMHDMKKHRDVLAKYGLTMEDVNVQSRGLINVLETIRKANVSLPDMNLLVGGYSAGLLKHLSSNVDMIKTYSKRIETEAAGTTERMKQAQIQSFKGASLILKSALEELKLSFFDVLEKPLAGAVNKLTGFITEIAEKIKKNRAPLDALVSFFMNVVEKIGSTAARWIRSLLGWIGVMADSTQESQRLMKSNLIPFLVFLEVMRLRIVAFSSGFKDGFISALQLAHRVLNTVLGPLGEMFDVVLPDGSNTLYHFGRGVGAATVLMIGFSLASRAAAIGMWLFNLALKANPLSVVIGALAATAIWLYTNKKAVEEWIDTLPPFVSWFMQIALYGVTSIDRVYKKWIDSWKELWKWLSDMILKQVRFLFTIADGLLSLLPNRLKKAIGISPDFKLSDLIPITDEERQRNRGGESLIVHTWKLSHPDMKGIEGSWKITDEDLSKMRFEAMKSMPFSPLKQPVKPNAADLSSFRKEEPIKAHVSVDLPNAKQNWSGDGSDKKPFNVVEFPKRRSSDSSGVSLREIGEISSRIERSFGKAESQKRDTSVVVSAPDISWLKDVLANPKAKETIIQEFKFGDIRIDGSSGDPETIARQLVPMIKKVIREESIR